ncbi:MAG: SAPS family protein, partial [archaeon]|nr:SAPS family protein [archaeon]
MEEEKKVEEIKTEEEKKEETKTEEPPKPEETKTEEAPKVDENKKEEIKSEEPAKVDEPIKEESKVEETKSSEPKKEESKEKEDKNRIELFDYFLSFLDTDKELNYVLVGYFAKFFSTLLSKRPLVLITYLFTTKSDSLERMIYHSYRKSISDLLLSIFSYEKHFSYSHHDFKDKDENNFEKEEIGKKREIFLLKLFKQISEIEKEKDSEKITNIISLISDLIETKEILDVILSNEEILSCLFNNLKVDLNKEDTGLMMKVNYSQILTIIIEIIKRVLSNNNANDIPHLNSSEDDDLVQQESNTICHTLFSKKIFETLETVLKNFTKKDNNKEIDTTFDKKIKPLGSYRVKIVEYLTNLLPFLKRISSHFDSILIKENFFSVAFDFIFDYPWNNFYQQEFFLFLRKYFEDNHIHTLITSHLFDQIDIIKKIEEKIKSDKKEGNLKEFEFNSNREIKYGHIPFLISLCYRINTEIGGEALNLFSASREGSITFPTRVDNNDSFNFKGLFTNNDELEEKKKKEETERKINSNLMKYNTSNWKEFFNTFIKENVKLYEAKLCEEKKDTEDEFLGLNKPEDKKEDEKEDDIFNFDNANPFGNSKTNELAKEEDWFTANAENNLKDYTGQSGNGIELTDGFEFTDDYEGNNNYEENNGLIEEKE